MAVLGDSEIRSRFIAQSPTVELRKSIATNAEISTRTSIDPEFGPLRQWNRDVLANPPIERTLQARIYRSCIPVLT